MILIDRMQVVYYFVFHYYFVNHLSFLYYYYFLLLYNIVLVLLYTNMNPPQVYTCSPSWTPLPTSLPIPSLWVIPVHQPQASRILHWTWTGDSFFIWYYTSFNAILPNHPTLSLSYRVQRLFYTSVSLLLSRIQGYRRRQWQPTPVLLPGKSHGWRNLVGCSPWDRTESDTTEAT